MFILLRPDTRCCHHEGLRDLELMRSYPLKLYIIHRDISVRWSECDTREIFRLEKKEIKGNELKGESKGEAKPKENVWDCVERSSRKLSFV